MDDYELMRLSDMTDSEGFESTDFSEGNSQAEKVVKKIKKPTAEDRECLRREKEKYFSYYDDIKLTPRDDW